MKTSGQKLLRAGVLAAGRGERLRSGANPLKPLVKVDGRTLIERVLTSLADAGAAEVVVIINEDSVAVRDHVIQSQWPFALRWIVETTPSSMHSFLRLVETLSADGDEGPFLLSTVDTVAGPKAYAQFMGEAQQNPEAAVILALTSPGNDEKPLLVGCAPGIHAFLLSELQRLLPLPRPRGFMPFAAQFSTRQKRPAAKELRHCGSSSGGYSTAAITLRAFP